MTQVFDRALETYLQDVKGLSLLSRIPHILKGAVAHGTDSICSESLASAE